MSLSTTATPTFPAVGQAAIEFNNVRLGFSEGEILRGVTFSAQERETLVLLGETGTGKTLLLKLASGLLRPDSGSVRVLGKDISGIPESELLGIRREIGFVFQEGALFDSLTVGENVAYRLHEDGVDPDEIEPRVSEVLRFVELAHTFDSLPSDLSGGMRRRVSIARALITRPPIVLYDSPTAGLDPITSQTIISLILRLRDVYGVTSLLATHRLQDGFALANFHFDPRSKKVRRDSSPESSRAAPTRFLVLRAGKIYFEGSPDDLMKSPDPYLQRFLI
ncbi:MAG TPA: ATP-binding cassette domain-containing protein [Candidatus Baltobacteraceae bacterium]|nr:ATP-binding cassette domain-containing protein [Candidatus Baltobacteraceae bacterium]